MRYNIYIDFHYNFNISAISDCFIFVNIFSTFSTMKLSCHLISTYIIYLYLIHLCHCGTGTQFASHVRVNTPARSFSHGVGDPIPLLERRAYQRLQNPPIRRLRRPTTQPHPGYPRQKPAIPFQAEEVSHGNKIGTPWNFNNFDSVPIQILPPSPYKVDSPDPESLWPIGLFIPPLNPLRFGLRRSDKDHKEDPYLLEGSEAVAAIAKADDHGQLYFHNIPHIKSLLANQDLRIKNNLEPHKIASIRKTWPFNRA